MSERKMTKEELAARLNGREYNSEITKEEEALAKAAGLVVLFGGSDDLAEFRGAIDDEAGCYDGDELCVVDGKLYQEPDCDCRWAEAARQNGPGPRAIRITAAYSPWTYKTATPHATFEIMEDGELYCRGIVFEALPAPAPPQEVK